MIVILSISAILLLFCIYMMIRNHLVCNEKLRILGIISQLASEDLKNRKEWVWRYRHFDDISYEKMLFTFWKPLKSFYKNSDILK